MASTTNQQFKITKFAKDLGMKSRDLVEMLEKNGIEAKTTQKVLEPKEFEILFDALTKENQISNIGSYLDGKTHIPSKVKKAAKPAKEEAVEESPAAKAEQLAKKSVPAKEMKEEKEEVKAPEKAKSPAKEEKAATEQEEITKQTAPKKTLQEKSVGAPVQSASAKPAARQPYTGNPFRPQQNGLPTDYGMQVPASRPQNDGNRAQSQQQNNRPQNGGNYNANGAQGARPQQGNGGFQPRAQGAGFGGAPKRFDASAGGQQKASFGGGKNDSFGRGRNDRNNNRAMGRGAMDHDKGDFVQSAPKDTFKAQPIVRGASTNINPDGTRKGPRVIDTHGSSVDLS